VPAEAPLQHGRHRHHALRYAGDVRLGFLVGLCACNQVFGVEPTEPRDAAFFDTALDAPFACPSGTVPQFDRVLEQAVFQFCQEYNVSLDHDRAVAMCYEPVRQIAEGKIDDTRLTPIPGFEAGVIDFDEPRLTPEGELIVRRNEPSGTVFELYTRAGASWTSPTRLQLPATVPPMILGTPSRGPDRRVFITGTTTVYELEVDTSGKASEVHQYTPAELGVVAVSPVPANLTADGLRLVFSGLLAGDTFYRTLYTERQAVTASFGAASAISSTATLYDPYLNSDCSRLYFSAAGSVFYAPRL